MPRTRSPLFRVLLLAAGGLALSLAFAPFPYRFLSFFALVPFLWIVEAASVRRAFLWGWTFGALAAGFHFWWLWFLVVPVEQVTRTLLNLGVVLLFGYLGLYFGLLAVAVKRLGAWSAVLALPVLEFLKAQFQIAFPWDLLGYTMTPWVPIVQLAAFGGVYLVSGWVMLVNVLVYRLLSALVPRAEARPRVPRFLPPAVALLAAFLLPLALAAARIRPNHPWFRAAIVQPDVSPVDKGDRNSYERIQADLLRLTREAAAGHPDLIIYPETATLNDVTADNSIGRLVRGLADSLKTPIFTGTPLHDRALGEWYNGAVLIRPGEDSVTQRHYKMRLVPFSEKIPYADEVPLLRKLIGTADMGNWSRGRLWTVFRSGRPDSSPGSPVPGPKTLSFSSLICYEAIFPDLARRFCRLGAELLVVVTNDGWFGRIIGSGQHAELAVVRTVENGVPMCRSANNGISFICDPYGRVLQRTALFTQCVLTGPVPRPIAPTPYRRFGDWYIAASLLGLCALAVVRICRR